MASANAPALLIGTQNRNKVSEVAEILSDFPVTVLGAGLLPRIPEVVESGGTFEENARIKALAFARAAMDLPPHERPRWVVSDDSGLCVDSLGGRPGVLSARYAEDLHGKEVTYSDNNRKLLHELEGIPPERRGASFVCVLAVVEVPGEAGREPRVLATLQGECHGTILEEERGDGGFGYDPVFLVPDRGRTFAELSPREKNEISHRGRALALLREKLGKEIRG